MQCRCCVMACVVYVCMCCVVYDGIVLGCMLGSRVCVYWCVVV